MSFNRFEIISTIYNTLQDSLKLVRRKEDGKLYTIKSVKIDENSEKEKELFFNELRILVPLTHKNIIWYKEAFYDKETRTLNMVIEYVDGGDLSMKIKIAKQKKTYLKENLIWYIFIQILEGIDYLHKKFIIHRDLKTSNIYLTRKGIVKIGGLNVGKNIEEIGMALTQIGTPYFTAPEIWEQKPYDYKCDIWSIGCILYEMASLHVPFLGLNMQELYLNVLNLKYKPIPNIYSKELNDMIHLILVKDSDKRPTASDLLKNNIIINKIKELNIKNEVKDESSFINKTVSRIINDYNNNIKKLDNTHIIYKKIDNKPKYNYLNLNDKNYNKSIRICINPNSNNNIKNSDLLNNRTNSESNKFIYMNKLRKNNNNSHNDSMTNNNNSSKNEKITEYNFKNNENYCQSAINQQINSIISNNSTGKIIDKTKKIVILNDNINNDYNNYKANYIKKTDINNIKNQNSINYINLNINDIKINTSKDKNNSNKNNKYKNFMLNNFLEKKQKQNIKTEIDLNNNNNKIMKIINNKNTSFINNDNKYYNKNNPNDYKENERLEKNLKKHYYIERIKTNQEKPYFYRKLSKKKINNNGISQTRNDFNSYNHINDIYHNNNNFKYGNNNIDKKYTSYRLKQNETNINNINNYTNLSKINKNYPLSMNNKTYTGDRILLDISKARKKMKSNNDYFINKDFNNNFQGNSIKKINNKDNIDDINNPLMNIRKMKTNVNLRKFNINKYEDRFKMNRSPATGRNFHDYNIANSRKSEINSCNSSNNVHYKNNICISEKKI